MIKGSLVAIVTPMHEDGSLDLDRYRALIDWHIESGTAAIVAVGTTGESPTVSVEEHQELIRVAVEHCKGRVPVIAGTGANSTREAIELTRHAQEVGAQATLQVAPVLQQADPGRPVPALQGDRRRGRACRSSSTTCRRAPLPTFPATPSFGWRKCPASSASKDATGDMYRGSELLARLPADFAVYSGNDDSALALMAMGAHGVISVTANVAPREMAQMCQAALDGRLQVGIGASTASCCRFTASCTWKPTRFHSNGRWPGWASSRAASGCP